MMKATTHDSSTDAREAAFAELKPPLAESAVVIEAGRCLFCFDAPCTRACPAGIDVPGFIKRISTRNYFGSARTILKANILGESCAKVCPVGVLCEGACVMHEKGEPAIRIGRLQRFVTQWSRENGKQVFAKPKPNHGSVGLIGSGPASLSCAAYLALKGYETIIYEADKIPGGLNAVGIASYKLRTRDALDEIEMIRGMGVTIKTGVKIGEDLSLGELLEKHDVIFVGAGLGQTHKLGVPGEELDGVMDALAFIREIKTRPFPDIDVGRRVVVVGGGNTAIDAASAAKRLGAVSVTVIYRRSEVEMPAFKHEYDHAKQDGVVFRWLTAPARIKGDYAVHSVQCFRIELGEPDASGRRRPVPVEGSEFSIEADLVLTALGQKADSEFIAMLPDIETRDGLLVADPDTGQTGNPRIFAGGDLVHGAKEVVNAVQAGKVAAKGIDQYLSDKED